MKIVSILILIFISTSNTYSQYSRQWVQRLNGTANNYDIANTMYLDEQSNSYIYSTLSNTNNQTDICAVKYSPDGNMLWKFEYNNSGNGLDQLQDAYKDLSNFSYITGYISESGNVKVITIKLSPAGDSLWTCIAAIPDYVNLISHSITIDNNNNIYVLLDGRHAVTSRSDFIILKYNSSGVLLNQKIFQGSTEGDDNGLKILCDADNNLFVGVNSFYFSTNIDMILYKLDSNLNEIYSKKINGAVSSDDRLVAMKLDNNNDVVLTGRVTNSAGSTDIGIYKFQNSNGNLLWQRMYDGAGHDTDIPFAITTDNQNKVYVTGYSRNADTLGSEDIITLKYENNGSLAWSVLYNGTANGIDQGITITTDSQNNVYVGGGSDHGGIHLEYITLKYNETGSLLWKAAYSNSATPEDFVYKIAVNSQQDIFISGISFSSSTDYDIATIKYSREVSVNPINETVNDFKLYGNFPNPFNPSTTIKFYNPSRNFISIKIFDLNGKEIAVSGNIFLNTGNYEYIFNAGKLSSGIYLYKIFYGNMFKSGKMILAK